MFSHFSFAKWVVLKVQGGETQETGESVSLNPREERALTGLVILGFLGFLFYRQTGTIIGAVAGAAIGYYWDSLRERIGV